MRGRSSDGTNIHPDAVFDLVRQEKQKILAEYIWQTNARCATRQTREFGGLDIHLLVDVSGSMIGTSADNATATAVCLLEGLALAKANIIRNNGYRLPDVRTHIIAFGSSAVELSLLAHQATPANLGRMYKALKHPSAVSTLISDALKLVQQTPPERDGITIIISDGFFNDDKQAKQIIMQLPDNHYIGQFLIDQDGDSITDNYQIVNDSDTLPAKLLMLLQDYIRKYI